MKRKGICGITVFLLAMCLCIPAWSYSLELVYFSDSNLADAYARRTYYDSNLDDSFMVVATPGKNEGQANVSQSATTVGSPAVAVGGATVNQAVVSTDQVATQSVIHTSAAAGHITSPNYEGYAQGYGDTWFGFRIVPGPGEASQVFTTLGFTVSGSVNLGKSTSSNQLILAYNGSLLNFDNGNDLQIAGEKRTWQGTTGSTNYSNG